MVVCVLKFACRLEVSLMSSIAVVLNLLTLILVASRKSTESRWRSNLRLALNSSSCLLTCQDDNDVMKM